MRDDQLAADYLKRLRRAARTMPRAPRRELLEQIAAHIAEARAGAAPLRGVLDELGEPEDIAATGRASGRLGGSEIAAVVLLLIGGFIFLVGWFVGLVLLWASPRWRWPDKLLGTLVWPGGLAGVAFVGVYGTSSSSGVACVVSDGGRNSVCVSHGGGVPPWLSVLLLVAAVAAPIAVAIRLVLRARRLPDLTERLISEPART